jgi:hypothetical protein
MIEAVSFFEMAVSIYQTTQGYIPKDSHLYWIQVVFHVAELLDPIPWGEVVNI